MGKWLLLILLSSCSLNSPEHRTVEISHQGISLTITWEERVLTTTDLFKVTWTFSEDPRLESLSLEPWTILNWEQNPQGTIHQLTLLPDSEGDYSLPNPYDYNDQTIKVIPFPLEEDPPLAPYRQNHPPLVLGVILILLVCLVSLGILYLRKNQNKKDASTLMKKDSTLNHPQTPREEYLALRRGFFSLPLEVQNQSDFQHFLRISQEVVFNRQGVDQEVLQSHRQLIYNAMKEDQVHDL